ncbi:FAD synthase [Aspergillus clavatus NRRL 1]|uniref:FAD synthase n=1 Tax=Aspergillus clavatus (strain ATCC 1007 / CBS 513.65 / DSM 816 / NCTC 3887 / NRRL 1 / QM 1276 / 107) TaxID=344612 RepID=A1CTZ0_ASPCL|nr:FAD synthetase, putative [Aspergillus clavatus NRRL 1]EAW06777.1 FAD synthetase, putative [Aspergillus clavatus NRRL 1]
MNVPNQHYHAPPPPPPSHYPDSPTTTKETDNIPSSASTKTPTAAPVPAVESYPSLSAVVATLHQKVHSFLSESHPPDSLLAAVQRQTRISLDVVATARARYKLSELCLSYNGGKDCLVLLILFLASLHPLPPPEDGGLTYIPAIYALPPDPFPDVEDFVQWSSRAYHLAIVRYTTDPPATTLRSSFEHYLSLNPSIKAIFVGTRRTDPHGANLTHFDPTDSGWPDFMRIHPVIDWHYAEIWAFIRHLGLRYCSLYDRGYTSLGGTTDTHPNPKLRVNSLAGSELAAAPGTREDHRYRPAYELTDDQEERLGRR